MTLSAVQCRLTVFCVVSLRVRWIDLVGDWAIGGWRQGIVFLSLGQPRGVSFPLAFKASVKFSGLGCLCWWLAGMSSGSSAGERRKGV